MRNNRKILISLIVVVLFLAAYISVSIERIEVNVNTENLKTSANKKDNITQQDLEKIRVSHNNDLNMIIADYEQIVKKEDAIASEQELGSIKNKLVSLIAPSENFKMVHLNLALSLSNYEEYIRDGQAEQKAKSVRHFENAVIEFKKLDNDNS